MFSLGRPWLENGIVDTDVLALLIKVREDGLELCCAPGRGNFLKVGCGFGEVLAHGADQRLGGPEKHSAIPVVIAVSQEFVCPLLIGLFGESMHSIETVTQFLPGFDIAISRFRTTGCDTHHYDVFAGRRELDTFGDDLTKVLLVLDHMIGRKHADDSVWILSNQDECR